jgi:hypothetical protein
MIEWGIQGIPVKPVSNVVARGVRVFYGATEILVPSGEKIDDE